MDQRKQEEYPTNRRDCQFAIRYLKWLHDSQAALEIGPEGVALLSAVVTMEDFVRYQYAPNFFNPQLASRAGFANIKTFDRVRDRCVEAGLLVYEAAAKRRPGRYWVVGDSSQILSKNYHESGMKAG